MNKKENNIDNWNDDVLNRKDIGIFLEDIIKSQKREYILTIDSPWGTGKSFLIERLISDLEKTHTCIKYNAWEEDFSESPFLSFITKINQSVTEILTTEDNRKKIQDLSRKVGKVLLGTLPILLKGGLRYLVGDQGVDAIKNLVSEDSESDTIDEIGDWAENQIKLQLEKQNSLLEFKKTLSVILNEIEKNNKELPLIIFIDDLDRCRPNFAVELLETIKHMFNIENLVFVIGVDIEQLCHSIKVIYGSGIDAETYLRKILTNQFRLPKLEHLPFAKLLNIKQPLNDNKYFHFENSPKVDIFATFCQIFNLSLRDQEQIFQKIQLIELTASEKIHFVLLIFLAMCSFKYNNLYGKLRDKKIHLLMLYQEVSSIISIRNLPFSLSNAINNYHLYFEDRASYLSNYKNYQQSVKSGSIDNRINYNIINHLLENSLSINEYINYVDLSSNFS
ncbi:hypothetical protein CH372_19170 [Leptospira meyeri]|uniref:KAP family P-loop NTPase fold protein n=1 Tax=Leptospira meyeri TaxID=29508 RepID=UPI000C29A066|nr:P-loop NTPase fold protein [Leptospira meyeri]PKA10483.1 hypothetical protein CH372_19170 [Leptospira meyeri]